MNFYRIVVIVKQHGMIEKTMNVVTVSSCWMMRLRWFLTKH